MPQLRKDSQKINIVIPMAGSGKRFTAAGYREPKPMIDVLGKPMLERVIENLTPTKRDYRFYFIAQASHFSEAMLEVMAKSKSYEVVLLDRYTEGAACSALRAKIDLRLPTLVASCDQIVEFDVDDFLDSVRGLRGAIVTYKTDKPNHSFCDVSGKKVIRVAEKEVISEHGNAGIYYFGRGIDFVKAADFMIAVDDRYNDEFYLSKIYNYLPGTTEIYEVETVHILGTPEDLERYLNEHNPETSR